MGYWVHPKGPLPENPHNEVIWSKLVPAPQIFDHLEVIGAVPSLKQDIPIERNNRTRYDDPLFAAASQGVQALKDYAGPYYRVIGSRKSVDMSIRKMDKPKCEAYKVDPFWNTAKALMADMYADLQGALPLTTEEVLGGMDMDKSNGVPWGPMGFKKKSHFFSSAYCRAHLMRAYEQEFKVVWKATPKTEWYHVDDLDANKVRTFIIPPTEMVYWGKFAYGRQNELLKGLGWSAYGFNPYSGGVDRLAREMLRHKIYISYDVRGWDRQLPILPEVYEFRNTKGQLPKGLEDWLTSNLCCTVVLLPDGTLVLKYIGNNSGSPNTTSDNILAHTMILFYVLLHLYSGDLDAVWDVVANLFGDDNCMGVPDPGVSFQEIEGVFRSCYLDFGLELDPFIISSTLGDHEFLGFKFKYFPDLDRWLPEYNIGRLVASFCYTIEGGMTPAKCVSKAWTLTLMASVHGGEVFRLMCQTLNEYCNTLYDDDDPVVRTYVALGAPSRQDCFDFLLGQEGPYDWQAICIGGGGTNIYCDV